MTLEFHFWNGWFYFMFFLLPLVVFVLDSWQRNNDEEKAQNKYHNLTIEERKQLASDQQPKPGVEHK